MKTAFDSRTEERRRLATRQINSCTLQTGEDIDVFVVRDLECWVDRAHNGLPAKMRRQQQIDRFVVGLPEVNDQQYVLAAAGLNETVSKARELRLLQRRKEDRQGTRQGRIAATTGVQSADQKSVEVLISRLIRLNDDF